MMCRVQRARQDLSVTPSPTPQQYQKLDNQ